MLEQAIELRSVQFTYPGADRPTVQIPGWTIPVGQSVFVYGPSGSGKTTLLELLSGVLVPEKGSIKVAGVEMATLTSAQRDQMRAERIGYIFQSFNLLPYLTVKENILLPLKLQGRTEDSSGDLKELVERLGIGEWIEKPVRELSVGQQQRVAVARALLLKPALLLADEPTSSLDYDNREKFLKVLFQLTKKRGTTLVFVSHDRSLESLFDQALSFADLNQVSSGERP